MLVGKKDDNICSDHIQTGQNVFQSGKFKNINYLLKQNLQRDEKLQIAHCEYPETPQEK